MTIPRSLDVQAMHASLAHLDACREYAPEGTYERACEISLLVRDMGRMIDGALKDAGLKLPSDDGMRTIESVIYGHIRASNPEEYSLITGEGFGSAMHTPARERVLAQTIANRNFLAELQASRGPCQLRLALEEAS